MTKRQVFFLLTACFFITAALACNKKTQPEITPSPSATVEKTPTVAPTSPPPTAQPTPSAVPATSTPPPTPPPATGPALTDVQFALDVEQTGELVYPATEFLAGVTRIYVRFSYRGLGGVSEVRTNWYVNENLVSAGAMAWDGGDSGDYIIWMEDPNGVGRGAWRWELVADGVPLGGGAFVVDGQPGYANEVWGLSFDPPVGWSIESEEEGFVTFSSPGGVDALAMRITGVTAELTETVAAELALFQGDHPDAQLLTTEDWTMNGERAILQQISYTDQENEDQMLYIVSAMWADRVYSLWVLGPAGEGATLQAALVTTLRSVRFLPSPE